MVLIMVTKNKIDAFSELFEKGIISEVEYIMIMEMLNNDFRLKEMEENIEAKKIISTVAKYYQIEENKLQSTERNLELIQPRYVAMYLMNAILKENLQLIARKFGNVDYSMIVFGAKRIDEQINIDFILQKDVENIKKLLSI